MASNDDLLINISADTKSASASLQALQAQFKALNDSMKESNQVHKETASGIDGILHSVNGLSLGLIKIHSAAALATEGFEILKEIVTESIHEYAESEKNTKNLSVALATLGQFSEENVKKFEDFALSIQHSTGVSEDLVVKLVSQAKMMGLTDERIKGVINSSIALSGQLGGVDNAFNQITNTLKGTARGEIVKFDMSLKGLTEEALANGEGVDHVIDKYAKLSGFVGAGLSGSILKLQSNFKELLKVIGEIIVGVTNLQSSKEGLAGSIEDLTVTLKDSRGEIILWGRAFVDIISGTFNTIKGTIMSLVAAFDSIVAHFAELLNVFGLLSDRMTEKYRAIADAAKASSEGSIKNAIMSIKNLFGFITGGGEEAVKAVDKTTEALEKLNEEGKANAGFKAITEEGKKGLEELQKKIDELQKASLVAGAGEAAMIEGKVKQQMFEIKLIEDKLVKGNAINDQSQKQLDLARQIAQASGDAEFAKAALKNLQELQGKNKELDLENRREDITAFQYLNEKHQMEIEILETKYKQLALDDSGKEALAAQIELLKKKNEIAKAHAETPEFQEAAKPGRDVAKDINSVTNGTASGMIGQIGGLMTGAGAVMGAVNGVLDFVQQLIDFIPQVLDKLAHIFDSLTDLPMKILEGVKNLGKSIVRLVTDLIPNLLQAIPDLLIEMIDHAFTKLPDAIIKLVERIPDLVIKFLDRLPEIVEKLVTGLVTNAPRIAIALVTATIKDSPRLAIALLKSYYIEIPKAIIKGFIEGAKQLLNMLKGIKISSPIDTQALAVSMKQAAKTLTGEASKLFKVMDLTEAGQSAMDKGKELLDEIEKATSNWFQSILDAWKWVYDNVIKPLLDGLMEVWNFWLQYVYAPLKELWDFVINSLLGLWNTLRGVWDTVMAIFQGKLNVFEGLAKIWSQVFGYAESVFNGLKDTVSSLSERFRGLGTQVWAGFQDAFGAAGSFFSEIGNKIFAGVKDGVEKIFNSINPNNLFEKIFRVDSKGQGKVESALGIDIPFANFASGGIVGGTAMVPGDSVMNDRILALVSPQEAIISRSKMGNPFIRKIVEMILDGKLDVPAFGFGGVVGDAVGGAVGGAVGSATEAFQSATDAATSFANDPGGTLRELAAQSAETLRDLWSKLDPRQALWQLVWGQVKDAMWEMFKANKFHDGGMIPSFAGGGEVPILGKAGEFVINDRAVNKLGLGTMNAINSGQMPMTLNQTFNQNITIDAANQHIDDNWVRNRMMPIVKEELRRDSLNGQTVIYKQGVR